MTDDMRPNLEVPLLVVDLLAGLPVPGVPEQAFALLTTDDAGFPHVCLLSRAELEADADEIRAAVASRRTGQNLRRARRATLVGVEGVTAHYLKMDVVREVEIEGRLGVALTLRDHVADSLGFALEPIGYVPTTALMRLEAWDHSARCLEALRASKLDGPGGAGG